MNKIRTRSKNITVGFKGVANGTDEALCNHEYAKSCTNFVFENGVLTGGFGIDRASGESLRPYETRHLYDVFPQGTRIRKFVVFRTKTDGVSDDRLLAHLENGQIWSTSMHRQDEWHKIDGVILQGDIEAVNYNYNGDDVILLVTPKDPMYVLRKEDARVCQNAPRFTSIAVHNERVYGAVNGDTNQVWFSDDFNPTNWTVSSSEAGFINFADEMGNVIKLVSFLNYLYIFRDYGIYRLTAYGNQSEFVLKKVFSDTGRIYKDTIVMCGDRIMFYAEGGIYVFDGYNVTRLNYKIPHIYNDKNVCAGYSNGCYYLACRLKGEGQLNDDIIIFNTKDKSVSFIGDCAVRWMGNVRVENDETMLCTLERANLCHLPCMFSKSGAIVQYPMRKTYVSPFNHLSSSKDKTVRSISFVSKFPITLTVCLDNKKYVYDIDGKDELQTVFVEHSGKQFGVEITTDEDEAYVSPLEVSMDIKYE